MKLQVILIIALLFSINLSAQLHDEAVDGDLSDQFDNPTGPFILEVGEQDVIANQQSDDVDYFSITIPEGLELDELVLQDFDAADPNNQAFLGMQEGLAFTTDASSTTASDLLGGITYGSQDLDTNLLIDMNDIGQGFDIPLPEGNYTFWLNQTGPNSAATLRFIVSENLSVDDVSLERLVRIFPNPVKQGLTIQSSAALRVTNLSIIDLIGKEVRSFRDPLSVDLNTLPTGVYFGRFTTDQGVFTKKIIKQ